MYRSNANFAFGCFWTRAATAVVLALLGFARLERRPTALDNRFAAVGSAGIGFSHQPLKFYCSKSYFYRSVGIGLIKLPQIKTTTMRPTKMKNKQYSLKILFAFFIPFILLQSTLAQEIKIDPKTLDEYCMSAHQDTIFILAKLFNKIGPNKTDSEIEVYREVHAEAMREEINRLSEKASKDKSLIGIVDLITTVSDQNYKYALCEKFKRPKASPVTIANESYLFCRKAILHNQNERPLPCF
jgi:hypothetical protein